MTRVRLAVDPKDIPRELHDEMNAYFDMCYAEAGYPNIGKVWNDRIGAYVNDPPVPDDVHQRAARLVCDRFGLPYEVLDA